MVGSNQNSYFQNSCEVPSAFLYIMLLRSDRKAFSMSNSSRGERPAVPPEVVKIVFTKTAFAIAFSPVPCLDSVTEATINDSELGGRADRDDTVC